MKRIFFFGFLLPLLGILEVSGQVPDTDSLERVLPNTEGNTRLVLLNELATFLRETKQEQALDYALEAEKLAKAQGDKSEEAKAKENIGWIYYRQGQWQKSFDYSKESYELAMEVEDLQEAARVLNNMGALYYEQKNYPQAIAQFKNAYRLSEEAEDLYTTIRSLNNVAYNFTLIDELDSARFYAIKAIEANEAAGSPYLTAFSHRVIGDIYLKKAQLDSAEYVFELAWEMAVEQGITSFQASILHRLGNVYLTNGKIDKAKAALDRGLEISVENQYLDEQSKSHKYLAIYHEKVGDINEAFRHQKLYLQLYDSLTDQSTRDRLALMQGMFQDDLNQSELDLLLAQNENQAAKLAFNRRIIIIISVAAIVVLALMIWLYFLHRNVKRTNTKLLDHQNKIQDQNADLASKSMELEEINQTKNKLFSVIGHDLRGPVGQVKTIVDLLIKGELDQEEFEELLKNLNKDVDSVYFTLDNTLKWSMAQMEGFKINRTIVKLNAVVKSSIKLLDSMIKEKGIHVNNQLQGDEEIFADRDLIEVVIRNILSNAIKYSNLGDEILLSADYDSDSCVLCINDQGVGMSKEQLDKLLSDEYVFSGSQLGTKQEKGSGLGLQVCKEFTRLNGGELSIDSELGKGTKICIKLPAAFLVNN
ncbi:tetratricopeptide repeat-containing sensor histidine kinase [Algoriphagus halophytocola]|uniref:histidine kinase n=1 Tax=Algoriphagus halophytocola TaxID=2991499 RepID=A0ABY6MJV3_9BACT|nr:MULTISPECIES: tetratricopeptide repeat-containing sensor histidine kinase [unclassified Algoriphagus]UZD23234.1 tetratricopeptide repeat-containing sensor histidine kinase [Algoriphagus sp. TR-M5]WBL44528.1 tetratricopeptide repeat-containing sensor histidine kinase [Algoriphagus sp. TR-M9]